MLVAPVCRVGVARPVYLRFLRSEENFGNGRLVFRFYAGDGHQ